MGLLDTAKGWFDGGKEKLQDTVATHADSIKGGIDKAGSVIDDKTGGKYTAKVATAQEKSKDLVDGLAGGKPADGSAAGSAGSEGPGEPPPDPGSSEPPPASGSGEPPPA